MKYELFITNERGLYKIAEANNEDMIIDAFMRIIFMNRGKKFSLTLSGEGVPQITAVGDGQCVIVETVTSVPDALAKRMKDFDFNFNDN